MENNLSIPMRFLSWSFVVSVVCLIAIAGGSAIPPPDAPPSWLVAVVVAVLLVAGFAYYVSLGILAKRLGRSWITWVGLTIITKPVGPFVAYFRMHKLVSERI